MTVGIKPHEMCNGKVNCPGTTDKIECSCLIRINPSQLCDVVYDCPSIEDELGCPDCGENQLTSDLGARRRLCFAFPQRCDGIKDCHNGVDEAACTVLSSKQKPSNVSIFYLIFLLIFISSF
jgi:hypothetical protein